MLLPSRRDARIPKSDKRWSWLETACALMPIEHARSVTHSSSDLISACSKRSRLSLASTLNTAANPPAWIGERRGRPLSSGCAQQELVELVAFFIQLVYKKLKNYTI